MAGSVQEMTCLTIVFIWGSNPISSMRSASSRTRYVTRLMLVTRASSISMRRPGVAMTISTPARRSRIWGPFGAPPYTHVLFTRELAPNFAHSCWIWTASSLVGAMTSAMGPSPGSAHNSALRACSNCSDRQCCEGMTAAWQKSLQWSGAELYTAFTHKSLFGGQSSKTAKSLPR